MKELNVLRTCAILHDIGKPECWAYQRRWTEHIKFTYQIVANSFDEMIAETAMRHHWSPFYDPEFYPKTDIEKIICLADSIASGTDRPEEPYVKRPKPAPPIHLSHPLSVGKSIKENSVDDFKIASEEIKNILRANRLAFNEDPHQAYLTIFEQLSATKLTDIPAYTEPPINDHSLFNHLKLTTAIATCIMLSGGYKGDVAEKYDFCLISGDADRIKPYIDMSRRLPDFIGGSEIIKQATENVARVIEQRLGPECIIFCGGGSFLVLAPTNNADEILRQSEEAFYDVTGGQLNITTAKTIANGEEVKDFGQVWERASNNVKKGKMLRKPLKLETISAGTPVCDVCGMRSFEKVDEYVLPIEAAPRADRLCASCYERRHVGKEKERKGISMDEIAERDPNRLIAVLKMDGDNIGLVFKGEKLKKFNKGTTPARLASLSDLINRVCEKELREIVIDSGGRCVYAGGDDLVAILPGGKALYVAREMAERFNQWMAEQVTMSAGIAIVKPAYPIYMALQASTQLQRNAKSEEQKASVDYQVIRGVGYLPQDLSYLDRAKRRDKGITGRPYKWKTLAELFALVKQLAKGDFASTQLRMLGRTLTSEQFEAVEYFIKRQVGRGFIPYEDGKMLFNLIKTGQLPDAIELLTLIEEGEKHI